MSTKTSACASMGKGLFAGLWPLISLGIKESNIQAVTYPFPHIPSFIIADAHQLDLDLQVSHSSSACTILMQLSHSSSACTTFMQLSHSSSACTIFMQLSHSSSACTIFMQLGHSSSACTFLCILAILVQHALFYACTFSSCMQGLTDQLAHGIDY